MKSVGVVRKIDELGRIVLPKELRLSLGINEGDQMEIYVEGDSVLLRKYEPTCVFCGDTRNVAVYKEKNVCSSCMRELKR